MHKKFIVDIDTHLRAPLYPILSQLDHFKKVLGMTLVCDAVQHGLNVVHAHFLQQFLVIIINLLRSNYLLRPISLNNLPLNLVCQPLLANIRAIVPLNMNEKALKTHPLEACMQLLISDFLRDGDARYQFEFLQLLPGFHYFCGHELINGLPANERVETDFGSYAHNDILQIDLPEHLVLIGLGYFQQAGS